MVPQQKQETSRLDLAEDSWIQNVIGIERALDAAREPIVYSAAGQPREPRPHWARQTLEYTCSVEGKRESAKERFVLALGENAAHHSATERRMTHHARPRRPELASGKPA